mmetsp:Transcript_16627/g.18823  ORF Transcript_16627/g.18823 Transcript_16627/m.18823 type:complete len:230 (-) Transcript_16627:182-871(-)|eukprot:CAMPEP_0118806750 /NCGR_PEP_ID=MMETSP1161-20130426/32865_1 /TAXON_ID=249345 /ORGANISM="Picochlorum oklahomensis, Strain CCMP2329" /LENGTH=229 /DNA_ID=CAMNT_0006735975 /DNA_START=37 /DNA_END=726 /DNA_ORIENTATION=-
MDKLIAQAKERGEKALSQLPADVLRISNLCDSLSSDAGEIEKAVSAETLKSPGVNGKLMELKSAATKEVLSALTSLKAITALVKLLVPDIHDGGNFGVGIQMQAIKEIDAAIKSLEGFLEEPLAYHEKRSGLLEKIVDKETAEQKTSTTLEAKEEKDKGTTKTESTTISKPHVLEDSKEAVIALDVKFYIKFSLALGSVRDNLMLVCDFVKKNESKIRTPRSSGGGYGF